jgi:hypothetical protein
MKEKKVVPKRTPLLRHSNEVGMDKDLRFLRSEFDYVRRHFFHSWDPKRRYRIGWWEDCPLEGEIQVEDKETKEVTTLQQRETVPGRCTVLGKAMATTINKPKLILFVYEHFVDLARPFLRALCVHEICHAVAGVEKQDHGKCWQETMTKASQRAKKLGQPLLAWFIKADIRREILTGKELEELEWDVFLRSMEDEESDYEKDREKMIKMGWIKETDG